MQIKFLLFRSLQNLTLLLQRDIKFLLKFPKSNIFKNVYLECSSCFYVLKHFLYISISKYTYILRPNSPAPNQDTVR